MHAASRLLLLGLAMAALVRAEARRVDLDGDSVDLRLGARVADGRVTVTTAPGSGFNEFLHTTTALPFLSGGKCQVRFRYHYASAEPDGRAYALLRSRSARPVHARDIGWQDIAPGDGMATVSGRLQLFDDYYLVIGIEGGGQMTVSDLEAELGTGGLQRVQPTPDTAVLQNPDKGWVLHFYDNNIKNYGSRLRLEDDIRFPGLSMVYFRLAWSFLEPEEGRLDWSMIDPWYRKFTAMGLKVGFRITCSETPVAYATPRWVEDAGAVFHRFARGDQREPDYGDPIFLEKLESFLARFAARYDADPNVAWIDVGSLGVWGEGHTFSSTRRRIPLAVQQRHLDLHAKYFRHATLIVNDDYEAPAVQYARGLGFGLRDDSICVNAQRPYFHQDMAEWFWRERPVIVETEHYGPSMARGAWDSETVARSIDDYHASWVSIHWWPKEFLAKEPDLVERLANRMGYWLFITEAVAPRELTPGEAFSVQLTWENRGVAPMYTARSVALALKNIQGQVVWAGASDAYDTRRWLPGEPICSFHSFRLPDTAPPGTYTLCVGLADRAAPTTPVIALAIAGRDRDRWHPLATVDITAVAN